MTAYLGPVGGLVPLLGMQAPQVTHIRETSGKVTLGGRLKTQRAVRSRREWTVSTHGMMSPSRVASVLALEAGGVPPWVWVEPYAQVTNMLTPDQSVLSAGTWTGVDVVDGGSAVGPDGVVSVRTLLHATGGAMGFGWRDGVLDSPAVLPGVPVVFSAYVRGAGILGITWRDSSGASMPETTKPYSSPTFDRVWFKSTPPAGAASARMRVTGALQAGNPALTWTPDVAAWSIGRGCNRAVVDGLSEAVQLAVVTEPFMRRSGISFTVREVG